MLFEIEYANSLNTPIRFFSVKSQASRITNVLMDNLEFAPGVYSSTGLGRKELMERIST
jgi:hypothetical protein